MLGPNTISEDILALECYFEENIISYNPCDDSYKQITGINEYNSHLFEGGPNTLRVDEEKLEKLGLKLGFVRGREDIFDLPKCELVGKEMRKLARICLSIPDQIVLQKSNRGPQIFNERRTNNSRKLNRKLSEQNMKTQLYTLSRTGLPLQNKY